MYKTSSRGSKCKLLKNLIQDPSKVCFSLPNISFQQSVLHIEGKGDYKSQTQKDLKMSKYVSENFAIIGFLFFKGWMVGRQITSIDAKID